MSKGFVTGNQKLGILCEVLRGKSQGKSQVVFKKSERAQIMLFLFFFSFIEINRHESFFPF